MVKKPHFHHICYVFMESWRFGKNSRIMVNISYFIFKVNLMIIKFLKIWPFQYNDKFSRAGSIERFYMLPFLHDQQ